jgi:hypothetical protein
MVGAIEIYNKPRFDYRDEVFVILLLNAWELLLKAVISKSKRSIFYKKKRHQPYRTLSCSDAMTRAAQLSTWPTAVPPAGLEANIELLSVYRDSAVHFYNASGFETLVYSLAQTSIMNYRDVLREVFGVELADEINWTLMPLGIAPPVEPISYLAGARPAASQSTAVDQFMKDLRDAAGELEAAGEDTGRLLTVFDVSLNSVKKIEKADITVGVGAAGTAEQVIVTRRIDPNRSHPYRRKDVLEQLAAQGTSLNAYDFDCAVREFRLWGDPTFWWRDDSTNLVKWSVETVARLRRLSPDEIETARAHRREQSAHAPMSQ